MSVQKFEMRALVRLDGVPYEFLVGGSPLKSGVTAKGIVPAVAFELDRVFKDHAALRTYVTVRCWGTDTETGEPRQWHHVIEDRKAAALVRRIEASIPGARAEVRA